MRGNPEPEERSMAEETGLQLYNVTQHQQMLQKQAAKLDEWCLPQANIRSDALIRHALHEMSLDSNLQACTPTSIYLALLACAVTGLIPGKMRSLAFLIPFKNTKKNRDDNGIGREITVHEATFMRGWRGVKLIGFRAGIDMVSVAVHQNDDFDFDKGSSPFVRYKPALRGAGPVIGAAAWAKLPRGGLEVEYMDLEELGKVEAFATSKSNGGSAAWSGPFKSEMQRKSALRRLGKQLEMGEDFHRGELIENSLDNSGSIAGALDVITSGEATRALTAANTDAMAFGALPAGKPEPARPAQVQVAAQVTEQPKPVTQLRGAAGKLAAREAAAANPTTPATSQPSTAPAASSSPSQTNSASTSSAPASGAAPTAAGSSPSKLDAAKAAVAAKATPTASAPPPSVPSASTASASPESNTASSGAASGEFGDVANEPAADEQFDASFGEDPEDSPPPPAEKSVEGFIAWLATCKTRAEIQAGKDEWIAWSIEQKWPKGHPETIRMQDAMGRRLTAVPK
jgi:phage RecT family recombinase